MSLISYILTFIEGILTFISPCILPMLPIYFIYLSGTSEGEEASKNPGNNTLLKNSVGFVTGFTIIFIALGATVTSIGQFLTSHKDLLQKISGIIMIIFGLNFIGILRLGFLNMEKRINFKFNRLGFFSSIMFGIVFGLGWTPCLGAFLGSALALASSSETILQGIMLLLLYSIGLGIPFIITSIVYEKTRETFKQIQKHSRIINIISGFLLIIAGILVFTDTLKYLGSYTF